MGKSAGGPPLPVDSYVRRHGVELGDGLAGLAYVPNCKAGKSMHTHAHTLKYTNRERERERDTETETERKWCGGLGGEEPTTAMDNRARTLHMVARSFVSFSQSLKRSILYLTEVVICQQSDSMHIPARLCSCTQFIFETLSYERAPWYAFPHFRELQQPAGSAMFQTTVVGQVESLVSSH